MPTYQTEFDNNNEAEVADWLSKCWRCEIKSFGPFSNVDWYMKRNGRLIGIAELKCRSFSYTKYQTVFISVTKWFHLIHGHFGLGVPAVFIIRFTDQVRWIDVFHIDATRHSIKGRKDRGPNSTSIEPAIEIPIDQMTIVSFVE